MNKIELYPRFAQAPLLEALADTPVVLIHGPRQSGKTTLAQIVGDPLGYTYFTFDDDVSRSAAQQDPIGFVADLPKRVILDEVQRVPEIFSALKVEVDRQRVAGRFILTGSANILLLPKLADSLAGRMEVLRLHPLAQCELARRVPQFLQTLFAGNFQNQRHERLGDELAARVVEGGYPEALNRTTPRRRARWYQNYVETIVQRDVRDLARISTLDALPRLLELAAGQTSRLFNLSSLASPFQLSRTTIRDYVFLLQRVFLLENLLPWHSNRISRLIKTPKLHLCDTGVACALLGVDVAALKHDRQLLGQLLETFVLQELQRQASWHDVAIRFFHFRNKDGAEVDIVLEQGAHSTVGIEVKASATVTKNDFRGLRKLQEMSGKRFVCGIVLYDGTTSASFGSGLYAIPIRALWET